MSKSKSIINAKPHKEAKQQKKDVKRALRSVDRTYQSQLKADPALEWRRQFFNSRPIKIYDKVEK